MCAQGRAGKGGLLLPLGLKLAWGQRFVFRGSWALLQGPESHFLWLSESVDVE